MNLKNFHRIVLILPIQSYTIIRVRKPQNFPFQHNTNCNI